MPRTEVTSSQSEVIGISSDSESVTRRDKPVSARTRVCRKRGTCLSFRVFDSHSDLDEGVTPRAAKNSAHGSPNQQPAQTGPSSLTSEGIWVQKGIRKNQNEDRDKGRDQQIKRSSVGCSDDSSECHFAPGVC